MTATETIATLHVGDLAVLYATPSVPTHGPVLFVHGYFVDGSIFSDWLPYFAARGFPAYSVHLRGRAGSRMTVDLGTVSMEDFADDASEVATSIGKPIVVGHSMGGLIAQMLCARGDARAAVLISPAPPRGIPLFSWDLATTQIRYLPSLLASRVTRPGREDFRKIVLNCVPHDKQDALLNRMIPDSGRAGRDMTITGTPVDKSRVKCPLLVLTAAEDRFIAGRITQRVAQRYNAPIRVFPGHGHMIVAEPGWEEVADAALHFAEAHDEKETRQ